MEITRIEPMPGRFGNKRYLLYHQGEIVFVLYKGDFLEYGLNIYQDFPQELSEDKYEYILHQLLPKRAEARLLHLLEKKDYTEGQLCKKLEEGYYPTECIQYAIGRMKEYGYVDDRRYIRNYIEGQREKKTYKQIEQNLRQRGITKQQLEQYRLEHLEDFYSDQVEEQERRLAERLLEKRKYHKELASSSEKEKQYRYLLGKGFSPSVIRKVL